jgi:hypothetical protein
MRRFTNGFFDAFFNSYSADKRLRLAVLLNEIEYNQEELVGLILSGEPDNDLTRPETDEMRRAITLIEERISKDNLRRMPRWFWDDGRFYADSRHPDFVVDEDNYRLKQRLMDTMFDEASNNFLQRSTFFHKHSLGII